jgi:HlyD family secretion protein
MDGIVSKLDVELGERVVGTSQMAGTEMLRIANLNNMEVRVDVNENDIVRVHRGDTAIIDVDAYGSMDKKFKGIITQIANTANGVGTATAAASGNSTESVTEFEVRIKILPSSYQDLLDERKYPFKPGMTATVDIITETRNKVLSVPIAAVTTRSGEEESDEKKEEEEGSPFGARKVETAKAEEIREIVFVNEGGKAKIKEVKTGITDTVKGTIEILSGLKEGEEVISGPYIEVSDRLKEGKPVVKKQEGKEKKDK